MIPFRLEGVFNRCVRPAIAGLLDEASGYCAVLALAMHSTRFVLGSVLGWGYGVVLLASIAVACVGVIAGAVASSERRWAQERSESRANMLGTSICLVYALLCIAMFF